MMMATYFGVREIKVLFATLKVDITSCFKH